MAFTGKVKTYNCNLQVSQKCENFCVSVELDSIKIEKNYNCNLQLQQNYEIIGLSVECYLFKVKKLTIVIYNCNKSWKY
jgi:hypothetical protein